MNIVLSTRWKDIHLHSCILKAHVIMLCTTKLFPEIFEKSKKCVHLILKNFSTKATEIEEKKVNVDGVSINYVKTGKGEHTVLLLPGFIGTIWTDFKPQIENLNKEKLTIIAWDPPGYESSRPPVRTFPENFHQRDAIWARNMMKTLGFNKFSLIGWSDGGISSLILAAMYPENVRKIITIGSRSYSSREETEYYEKIQNISTWSEKMRTPIVAIPGEKYVQDAWSSCIDTYRLILEKNHGDICKGGLSKIKCPTLIVHGKKDPMAFVQHADYLHANIKNSKVEIFKTGAHNLHLYPDEFNALAYKFLMEQEDLKL